MVYGSYKVKKKKFKFLVYVVAIICVATVLGVFIPVDIRDVSQLILSESSLSTLHVAYEKATLTFDEGREKIQASEEVKKTVQEIIEDGSGLTTIFIKHKSYDEYVVAFSHGAVYAIVMEAVSKSDKQQKVLRRYHTMLTNTPIAATWHGSFIVVVSANDKGQAFFHMIKKSKREDNLKIAKTLEAPFFVRGQVTLHGTSYGIFVHAENTVYLFTNNAVQEYEKNVCSLPSVVEQSFSFITTSLYAADASSCKSYSSAVHVSSAYSQTPAHLMNKRLRIGLHGMQLNLFSLAHALSTRANVRFFNEDEILRDDIKQPAISYTYGNKNYTIAIR